MLRRIMSVVAVAAILTLGGSAAAYAIDEYPPPPPSGPTLAGSFAVAECAGDVPWIRYSVVLDDPNGQVTNHAAVLRLSSGGESVEIPLGTLADGPISGRVLWPGASVDADGNPNGWPGWAFENGQWVETSGNFAWTRGSISAVIHVNPDLAVALSYPPATAACASPVTGTAAAAGAAELPVTGGAAPLAALGIGVVLLGAGAAVVVQRRRRAAR